MIGKLGLHLGQTPSGRWAFSGNVPGPLAYIRNDGEPLTEEDSAKVRQVGPRIAGVKSMSWATRDEAVSAALAAGIEVQA